MYRRRENIQVINDTDNICQTLILSMSAQIPVQEALKLSINVVTYKRLKQEFSNFVNDYILYNFNMQKAIQNIDNKFSSNEFNMLLEILNQKDQNILDNLDYLSKTLEISYYKYLKYKENKNTTYISLAVVLSLTDIIMVVVYPLFIQIIKNLNLIFS